MRVACITEALFGYCLLPDIISLRHSPSGNASRAGTNYLHITHVYYKTHCGFMLTKWITGSAIVVVWHCFNFICNDYLWKQMIEVLGKC